MKLEICSSLHKIDIFLYVQRIIEVFERKLAVELFGSFLGDLEIFHRFDDDLPAVDLIGKPHL